MSDENVFLLTPLREGRRRWRHLRFRQGAISTHAPAGGATNNAFRYFLPFSISTHAPAGGATRNRYGTEQSQKHFYSRPCGRGDVCQVSAASWLTLFLLTPLREGRLTRLFVSTHLPSFLLTPLREGRPQVHSSPLHCIAFLLTPLREGRLIGGAAHFIRKEISTHAPAGGATRRHLYNYEDAAISTHAPAGGATFAQAKLAEAEKEFLLTPLREGRRHGDGDAAGADRYFYSRPCGRSDDYLNTGLLSVSEFLLTPLREGRPKRRRHVFGLADDFYSRPCGRGDCTNTVQHRALTAISTHAPAGGATQKAWSTPTDFTNFYSRPCGRGDTGATTLLTAARQFLLTPLREGRLRG